MAIVDFDTECWGDPWVQQLTPTAKLLFVYLWTNVHRNIAGLYVITRETIAFDTKIPKNQLVQLFLNLSPKVKYDPDHSVCWVVKHARRQFLRGEKIAPKQREGIRRHALKLKWHPFFQSFLNVYPELFSEEERKTLSKGMDTLSKGMDTLGGGGGGKGNSFKEEIGVQREEEERENPFARFWLMYPKKKSKGQAEKAFAKINPDEQLLETMISKIERAKKSDDWTKEGGKFIPHPATWLNAKGWEDETSEEKPKIEGDYPKAEDVLRRQGFSDDYFEIGESWKNHV